MGGKEKGLNWVKMESEQVVRQGGCMLALRHAGTGKGLQGRDRIMYLQLGLG